MIPDSVYLLLLVMLILAAPFAAQLDRYLEDDSEPAGDHADERDRDYNDRADAWRKGETFDRQRHPA